MLEPMEINGSYYLGHKTPLGFVIIDGWADLASFGIDLKKWVDFYNEHRVEVPDVFSNAFKEEEE